MRPQTSLFALVVSLISLSCVQDVATSEPPPVGRPVVMLISPTNNAVVVDSTYIEADALDDKNIVRVEIYVDYRLDSTRIFASRPYRWKWDVRSLLDSSNHKIHARAYDDDGNATNSSLLNVVVRVSSLPPAPSGLDALSMSATAVTLQWQDNSGFETGFDVMLSTDDGRNYVTVGTVAADVTQTTLAMSFSPAAVYLFRVRARAGVNVSSLSNGVRARYPVELYAGGSFTSAGGTPASNIARWDGTSWSSVGGGTDGPVFALAVFKDELYVGGQFGSAGGIAASRVARWNGRSWTEVGGGTNNSVYALTALSRQIAPTVLFAGGVFVNAGGARANRVAMWDGASWSALGDGMGEIPGLAHYSHRNDLLISVSTNAFTVLSEELYAGGRFGTADGRIVNNVAKGLGLTWQSLGEGTNAAVHGLAVYAGRVYAGGEFDTADGIRVNHVAEWSGGAWRAMGSGMNAPVRALLTFGGVPFAGGDFTIAGGATANHVARFSGGNWTAVGGGMDGPAYSFVVHGNLLYAGGNFATAGGVGAASIARWDGASWAGVGGGLNGPVRALASYGYWSWMTVP